MKFVLISNSLQTVRKFREDLLIDINKVGYEIYILAPELKNFTEEVQLLKNNGFIVEEIKLNRTGTNPIVDFKCFLSIYFLLKKIKPDVILSYTIKPIIYGTLAGFFAGIPKRFTLISGLGFAFQNHTYNIKTTIVKKIVNTLYKFSLQRAHKVFFQNPDDQELLKNLGILHPATLSKVVNGSGVNTEYYQKSPLILDELGNYEVSFLMVARLLHDKGIREYLKAAQIIKQKYPQTTFNLVGGLDQNPAAISKQELDEIIDTKIIQYWGQLSDVRSAIIMSNIFVLPSYREGVPRSVLEAMSMGRAIITTDAPGCKETVIHGENGFKVKVQSVDDLVHAMSQFIEQPMLIKYMGNVSRNLAIAKYDVREVNSVMISEMNL